MMKPRKKLGKETNENPLSINTVLDGIETNG